MDNEERDGQGDLYDSFMEVLKSGKVLGLPIGRPVDDLEAIATLPPEKAAEYKAIRRLMKDMDCKSRRLSMEIEAVKNHYNFFMARLRLDLDRDKIEVRGDIVWGPKDHCQDCGSREQCKGEGAE